MEGRMFHRSDCEQFLTGAECYERKQSWQFLLIKTRD